MTNCAFWLFVGWYISSGGMAGFNLVEFQERVFWGPETNGVKVGVCLKESEVSVPTNIAARLLLYPLLTNGGTNSWVLEIPKVEQRFRLEMTDEKGTKVPKTAKGKKLGKSTPKPYKPAPNPITGVTHDTGYRPLKRILSPGDVLLVSPPLLLHDYFQLDKPGKYMLNFEMVVFKSGEVASNKVQLIHFPPMAVEVEVK